MIHEPGVAGVPSPAIHSRRAHTGGAQVQLTTNKARTDAQRFYEQLGFEKSHEGMKLKL